jgi:hypothetical protein
VSDLHSTRILVPEQLAADLRLPNNDPVVDIRYFVHWLADDYFTNRELPCNKSCDVKPGEKFEVGIVVQMSSRGLAIRYWHNRVFHKGLGEPEASCSITVVTKESLISCIHRSAGG